MISLCEIYTFCCRISLNLNCFALCTLTYFAQSNLDHFSKLYASLTSTTTAASNFNYLPYGPFQTQELFLDWYNRIIQPSKAVVWFAILVNQSGIDAIRETRGDKGPAWEKDVQAGASDGSFFAGSIGLLNAEVANASCEMGHVSQSLPLFSRSDALKCRTRDFALALFTPSSVECVVNRRDVTDSSRSTSSPPSNVPSSPLTRIASSSPTSSSPNHQGACNFVECSGSPMHQTSAQSELRNASASD